MTEGSVQVFMFYFLICNHLHKQCLLHCVIQYMREFNVFLCISPYSMFEIVYVEDFCIMRWSFILYFWSTFLICDSVSSCEQDVYIRFLR